MAPWDFVIFELRKKSWKVSQQPLPSPPPRPREFGIKFCHFELRNKSWKVGEHCLYPTRHREFGILLFLNKNWKVGLQSAPPNHQTKDILDFVILEHRNKSWN